MAAVTFTDGRSVERIAFDSAGDTEATVARFTAKPVTKRAPQPQGDEAA